MSSADESGDLNRQCEEIEALSAIYGDDFLIVDEVSRLYEVRVSHESDSWWSGTLQILLPPQYPSKVPPVFEIHSAWMSDSEMFEITDKLHSIHRENRGEIVLYLWVEKLREFIDNKVVEFAENEQLVKGNVIKVYSVFFFSFFFHFSSNPEQKVGNVIIHIIIMPF